MRKTAKNSTFKEWRNLCKYFSGEGSRHCSHYKYQTPEREGWCAEDTDYFCEEDCPRMKRWERIHKDD